MKAPNGYTASVSPASQQQPQSGQPGNVDPNNNALGAVKSFLRSTNQAPVYDPVFNNIYEDKTLAAFRAENGNNSEETKAYFKQFAAKYIIGFLEHVKIYRNGTFYVAFHDTVERYSNLDGRGLSHAKQAFSMLLSSRVDLSDKVAVNASVWFGHIMANHLERSENGNVHPQKAVEAARIATINILNLEFVLWLNGSSKAEPFMFNPSPDVMEALQKFNKRKEISEIVFQYFDEQSPYASANFDGKSNPNGNYGNIIPEYFGEQYMPQDRKQGTYTNTGDFIPDFSNVEDRDMRELLMIPFENVRRTSGMPAIDAPRPINLMDYEETGGMQPDREDLHNINLTNRNQFNIRRYFKRTVAEGWYEINERDWKYLRNVLKKHPEQRAELTALGNAARFVNIDLDNESRSEGWRSTIVVFEDEQEEKMILSDPEKLLPLLLNEQQFDENGALPVADLSAALANREKLQGWDEEFEDHMRDERYKYHVVKLNEVAEHAQTIKVVENLSIASLDVKRDFSKPLAIFSEFDAVGRQLMDSPEKCALIQKRYPELFKGHQFEKDVSYFTVIQEIARKLKYSPVDEADVERNDRFDIFIANRLTIDMNNWLINSCGYENDPKAPGHLSVDNVLEDFNDLREVLYNQDKFAFDALNEKSQTLTLLSQIQMFEPITEPGEELTVLERKEHELQLKRSRRYSAVTIINDRGPRPVKGKMLVLKRSVQPEFFSLLDTLKSELVMKGRSIESENIVFYYKDSSDVFMVTPVIYDENVVTIRNLSINRSLLNPLYQ